VRGRNEHERKADFGQCHTLNPRIIQDVHELVNWHRGKVGLPEWDFDKSPSEQWWKKFPPFGEMVAKRLAQIRKHTFGGYQFEHLWKLTQAFIKQRNKDFTIPRTVKSGSIIKRGTSSASDASARSPRA